MRLTIGAIVLLSGLAQASFAQDDALKRLSVELHAIRGTHGANQERDAGPEFNAVKASLRALAERRFAALNPFVPAPGGGFVPVSGLDEIAARLNEQLKSADLTCDGIDATPQRCADDGSGNGNGYSARGFIGGVGLSFLNDNRYLLLQTALGVRCGYDESAYVYEWRKTRWQLLFAAETDDYREKHYEPQNFFSVQASPADVAWNEQPSKPPLILTLGYSPWCWSNWQALYVRLSRVSMQSIAPRPILDLEPTLYMGNDRVAAASLSDRDIFIEFEGNSLDGGARTHELHYGIRDGDRLERLAPAALNPRDFVDEWLTRPWAESGRWIDANADESAIARLHKALHKDFVLGEFDGDTMKCRSDPTLWQVGFAADGEATDKGETLYYLVRWMAPYRFSIVDIRKDKFPGCDIVDPMPDNPGSLFLP